MTKLQLHVVCAVVAAARAIEAAGQSKADELRSCGEWAASLMHTDEGVSVRVVAPKEDRKLWQRSNYRVLDAPLIALTDDRSEPEICGIAVVATYDMPDEKVFEALKAGGVHVRELPRVGVDKRLTFDWRNYEPTKHSGLVREEILRLPKEERLAAYKANPGETVSHYDCRCPECKHRYAVDCLVKNADEATKCPRCEVKKGA